MRNLMACFFNSMAWNRSAKLTTSITFFNDMFLNYMHQLNMVPNIPHIYSSIFGACTYPLELTTRRLSIGPIERHRCRWIQVELNYYTNYTLKDCNSCILDDDLLLRLQLSYTWIKKIKITCAQSFEVFASACQNNLMSMDFFIFDLEHYIRQHGIVE